MAKRLIFTLTPDSSGSHTTDRLQYMIDQINSHYYGDPCTVMMYATDPLRSSGQNRYWMGTFLPYLMLALKHNGWDIRTHSNADKMEIHYKFVRWVWGEKSKMVFDDGELYVEYYDENPESSKLRRDDFRELITKADRWVVQNLGALIPRPGEYTAEITFF